MPCSPTVFAASAMTGRRGPRSASHRGVSPADLAGEERGRLHDALRLRTRCLTGRPRAAQVPDDGVGIDFELGGAPPLPGALLPQLTWLDSTLFATTQWSGPAPE